MHIPDEAPPLKLWPFLAGDAILVASAFLIANNAQLPFSALQSCAIAGCVALGAVLAVIPFVLNHTRKQDIALADRQREISALAQTTASSAEQISIAAASLHTLADHTARALKLGEALPHKLQEKINDFKTQLNEVAVTENEALSQEINTLRTSETERLETALAGVRKIATELSGLEASTQKHLKELSDTLARFTADAGKSADNAAKSIDSARAAAEKSLAASHTAALAALQESVASTLANLDRKFSSLADKLSEQLANSKTTPAPTTPPATEIPLSAPTKPAASTTPQPTMRPVVPPPSEIPVPAPTAVANTKAPLPEPPAASAKTSTETAGQHSAIAKIQMPATSSAALPEPAAENVPTALLTEEKPVRKRTARKPFSTDNELALGIELPESNGEFFQDAPDETAPAVSADGLTRLIVTAYIGIGNKLYARGEGPGLAWDRGVPLQFVSIGKWRWESPEVTAPVRLKLYKNDTQECSAVGTLTIAPGQQHEVTANFN